MELTRKLEALLLYREEPQSYKNLCTVLESSLEEIQVAVASLTARYAETHSGMCLIDSGASIALGTAPELKEFIETLTKSEYERELGPAALETLALILYKAPISRSAIDRIRGVNSSYILRHLLVRGFVERKEDVRSKSQNYIPTAELLAYLGVANPANLPDREKVLGELEQYLEATSDTPANNPKEL